MTRKRGGGWQKGLSSFTQSFKAPETSLGALDADAAATVVVAASDVALVVDADGIVQDVGFNNEILARDLDGHARWRGKPWRDIVTLESRPKVDELLKEAASRAPPRWRHMNHATGSGVSVPILYSAVQIGDEPRYVAFGRDLRPMSELQQRLVDAQQSLERDYSRLHHAESRYRMLFQTSTEAVLMVDAATQKITEVNPAADTLFGGGAARRLVGRPFSQVFEPDSVPGVQALLGAVRAAGRADDVRARLQSGGGEEEVIVSASPLRQDSGNLYLVRLARVAAAVAGIPKIKAKMLKVMESAPDGFVLTDFEANILSANAAFLELVQLPTEEQARGQSLDRWLGRPGVDLDVLTANLRQRGSVRLFTTSVRSELGAATEVEISAVSVMNGGNPCFGFAIRNVGARLSSEPRAARELPRSVEQLTELIGRVSLKDLVREATDAIERLCIEAALELTGDNRASAAEMLGLSRQSLYVKLRRYGLGDLAQEGQP
jgi:transcriptional regulator PpsR